MNAPLPLPLDEQDLRRVFDAAWQEDVGSGDVTSSAVFGKETARYAIVAREACVLAGLPVLDRLVADYGKSIRCEPHVQEGEKLAANQTIAVLSGHVADILTLERIALNILQRMCGIATITAEYVAQTHGTNTVILDTRKTTPGLRRIEKYAVTVGGGQNHRMGLFDAVMLKDNHIAAAGGVAAAMARVAAVDTPVIVECDTAAQVADAVQAGATHILLDNMTPTQVAEIVNEYGSEKKEGQQSEPKQAEGKEGGQQADLEQNNLREQYVRESHQPAKRHTNAQAIRLKQGANKITFEASGGMTLDTIRDYAITGVDYISVGAITHSAPTIDIGLDVV